MQKISDLTVVTNNGTLKVSRIKDGVAYDQYNKPIPRKCFRFQLSILDQDYENSEVLETV